jgi:hypothetical protein
VVDVGVGVHEQVRQARALRAGPAAPHEVRRHRLVRARLADRRCVRACAVRSDRAVE